LSLITCHLRRWRGNGGGKGNVGGPGVRSLFSPLLRFPVAFLCALLLVSACGKKTPIRPPELVAPEPIGELRLETEAGGIRLQWERPQRYVDGREMDDLGGFVVLRATQDARGKPGAFTPVGTVPIEDRDRFRQAKRFSYVDRQLAAGTLYRYRVQAFTLDGYYSTPSNTVELIWKGG
jgi:hypothetical protein